MRSSSAAAKRSFTAGRARQVVRCFLGACTPCRHLAAFSADDWVSHPLHHADSDTDSASRPLRWGTCRRVTRPPPFALEDHRLTLLVELGRHLAHVERVAELGRQPRHRRLHHRLPSRTSRGRRPLGDVRAGVLPAYPPSPSSSGIAVSKVSIVELDERRSDFGPGVLIPASVGASTGRAQPGAGDVAVDVRTPLPLDQVSELAPCRRGSWPPRAAGCAPPPSSGRAGVRRSPRRSAAGAPFRRDFM